VAGLAVPEGDAPPTDEVIDQLASGPSRLELFLAGSRGDDTSMLATLAERNLVNVYTFANRAKLAATVSGTTDTNAAHEALANTVPDGPTTDVTGAIRDVLNQSRSMRLAGIIVASDGVSTVRGDMRIAGQAAQRRHVPIHAVLLGSSIAPRDVSVGPVFAEDTVFVKDLVAVKARVATHGFDKPLKVSVSLREKGMSIPLATETITVGGDTPQQTIELRTKPTRGGKHTFEVAVAPRPEEIDHENNRSAVDVTIIDDRLRVLYVDDEPRFEYRYLKNTLVREETMIASCLLLSADASFAQEGDEPITHFPESPEELYRYDVVLFGDVDLDDGWFTPAQLSMLVDFVGQRGGGFGLISGPRHAPHTYRGSPLELLLPVRLDPQYVGQGPVSLTTAYQPVLTDVGKLSPIFRFELEAAENLETFEQLPGLYWLARTLGAKPGAEVLAEHPTVETLTGPAPVMVVGRYGAGRTFFQATDETWRWREYTGEGYFDAYWIGVLRYLARSKVIGRDRRFELSVDAARVEYGEPVTIRLTVLDTGLIDRLGDRLEAQVVDAEDLPIARVELTRLGAGAKWFEGTFTGPRRGSYTVKVSAVPLAAGEKAPSTTITVASSSLESRILHADHAALRQLSSMTEGGSAVRVDELATLAESIEDRSVLIPDDIAEELWDSNLVLALFVLIIMTEWVLRKALDLV